MSPSKRLRDGGLEMLLDGRDPDSGELLKSFRAGNVRAYEIPLNDSKDLDVGVGMPTGTCAKARMKAQARGEEAVEEGPLRTADGASALRGRQTAVGAAGRGDVRVRDPFHQPCRRP